MSTKEVVVSNVAEGHSNPVAELVQVACRFESEIILESNNRRINVDYTVSFFRNQVQNIRQ